MIERIKLDDLMELITKPAEDVDLLDKDGEEIKASKLNYDELDLLTSDCNVIDHITPLTLRTEPKSDNKEILEVFFLFKTRSQDYFIAQANYEYDKDPELTKLFKKSLYSNLVNSMVFDHILDTYHSKTVHIDMHFRSCDNGSNLYILPCINSDNLYQALFINNRQLAQLSFFDNYFMYLNMNDRILYNILKEKDTNIIEYNVSFVNGIEKVAKAGKHTVACVTSLECEFENSIQDIHILSSHECGARIKRSRTNYDIKDLNNTFGKSRREFIVSYISKIIMDDKEIILIRAKNSSYGDVIFRFDDYQSDSFMKMIEKKTNMK